MVIGSKNRPRIPQTCNLPSTSKKIIKEKFEEGMDDDEKEDGRRIR
jgi:hypothetical protein